MPVAQKGRILLHTKARSRRGYRQGRTSGRLATGRAWISVRPYGDWSFHQDDYATIRLSHVREALDFLTLEDEGGQVEVPVGMCRFGKSVAFSLKDPATVRVTAPCGQTVYYKVRSLDRLLTRMGA